MVYIQRGHLVPLFPLFPPLVINVVVRGSSPPAHSVATSNTVYPFIMLQLALCIPLLLPYISCFELPQYATILSNCNFE